MGVGNSYCRNERLAAVMQRPQVAAAAAAARRGVGRRQARGVPAHVSGSAGRAPRLGPQQRSARRAPRNELINCISPLSMHHVSSRADSSSWIPSCVSSPLLLLWPLSTCSLAFVPRLCRVPCPRVHLINCLLVHRVPCWLGLYTLFFRFYILFRSDFQRFPAGI